MIGAILGSRLGQAALLALAALAVVGVIYHQGGKDERARQAEKAAAATLDNLKTRGKIDAGLAASSKDDLCKALGDRAWDAAKKECVQ